MPGSIHFTRPAADYLQPTPAIVMASSATAPSQLTPRLSRPSTELPATEPSTPNSPESAVDIDSPIPTGQKYPTMPLVSILVHNLMQHLEKPTTAAEISGDHRSSASQL